jgi:hypothetical protein
MFGQSQFLPTLQNFTLVITFARISSLPQMGYQDCQYIAISHHRDDPGHDEAHEHDHIHIVANAVSMLGERVSDSHERYRIQPILREIEQEFGLKQLANSWDVKRENAQTLYPETDLSVQLAKSLENCPDLTTWLDRLAEDDIDVRFALRKDGAVRGVSFLKDGEIHKGSTVGASWTIVDEQLGTSPTDLPLMTAANLKSQEHQLNLSNQERWEFDQAVKMAMAALKGGDRFKSGRVDIKLEDETLTVYRMRPHKQMLKASKTDEGWAPIGCPDLDKKDLDLLSKVSGMRVGVMPEQVETTLSEWETPEQAKWVKQKWDDEEAIYQEMLRREKEAAPPKRLTLDEIANLPKVSRVVQTRRVDRDGR